MCVCARARVRAWCVRARGVCLCVRACVCARARACGRAGERIPNQYPEYPYEIHWEIQRYVALINFVFPNEDGDFPLVEMSLCAF